MDLNNGRSLKVAIRWTANSSSHMTLPMREVVGAVYDRAFSCARSSTLSMADSRSTRRSAEEWPHAGEIARLPTEKKERAVIDRAYNLPHRLITRSAASHPKTGRISDLEDL